VGILVQLDLDLIVAAVLLAVAAVLVVTIIQQVAIALYLVVKAPLEVRILVVVVH
jgi:hypothetical protein